MKFTPLRAKLIKNLFRIPMMQFEISTMIPHVHCLAYPPPGVEDTRCLLISSEARNDPISHVHYMFGHPNAAKTRHLCKCYNFQGIKKLEVKAFEFLKNCEFCRLAKAKRSSFSGIVARPKVLGKFWYADIKGLFRETITCTSKCICVWNNRSEDEVPDPVLY